MHISCCKPNNTVISIDVARFLQVYNVKKKRNLVKDVCGHYKIIKICGIDEWSLTHTLVKNKILIYNDGLPWRRWANWPFGTPNHGRFVTQPGIEPGSVVTCAHASQYFSRSLSHHRYINLYLRVVL